MLFLVVLHHRVDRLVRWEGPTVVELSMENDGDRPLHRLLVGMTNAARKQAVHDDLLHGLQRFLAMQCFPIFLREIVHDVAQQLLRHT